MIRNRRNRRKSADFGLGSVSSTVPELPISGEITIIRRACVCACRPQARPRTRSAARSRGSSLSARASPWPRTSTRRSTSSRCVCAEEQPLYPFLNMGGCSGTCVRGKGGPAVPLPAHAARVHRRPSVPPPCRELPAFLSLPSAQAAAACARLCPNPSETEAT